MRRSWYVHSHWPMWIHHTHTHTHTHTHKKPKTSWIPPFTYIVVFTCYLQADAENRVKNLTETNQRFKAQVKYDCCTFSEIYRVKKIFQSRTKETETSTGLNWSMYILLIQTKKANCCFSPRLTHSEHECQQLPRKSMTMKKKSSSCQKKLRKRLEWQSSEILSWKSWVVTEVTGDLDTSLFLRPGVSQPSSMYISLWSIFVARLRSFNFHKTCILLPGQTNGWLAKEERSVAKDCCRVGPSGTRATSRIGRWEQNCHHRCTNETASSQQTNSTADAVCQGMHWKLSPCAPDFNSQTGWFLLLFASCWKCSSVADIWPRIAEQRETSARYLLDATKAAGKGWSGQRWPCSDGDWQHSDACIPPKGQTSGRKYPQSQSDRTGRNH